jgi:hypothetical protein
MDGLGAVIVVGVLVGGVALLRFVLPRFGIRPG